MSDTQRLEGESNADFAARLRELANRIRGSWQGSEKARELLDRADRVERGEEPSDA
ncbi:hypothetical protein [Amycolatopsis vastitatis]|uniref:hypothetical protein n=1 Tax=Amycolatopsis vastitatis TaxID=1905142 RepID=UPI001304419A|nr:hypothetical protein [Amycolatopsis vastitatis]